MNFLPRLIFNCGFRFRSKQWSPDWQEGFWRLRLSSLSRTVSMPSLIMLRMPTMWSTKEMGFQNRPCSMERSENSSIIHSKSICMSITWLTFQVTKLDDLSPVIFLNRTKAALNCAAGSMQVKSIDILN